MQFQPQNSEPAAYNSPNDFNRVFNDPYYTQERAPGLNFPDHETPANYNSNHGVFSAFDRHENASPFGSMHHSGRESIKFPSNSNMVSTNYTSGNMQQFQANPQCEFPLASRIS